MQQIRDVWLRTQGSVRLRSPEPFGDCGRNHFSETRVTDVSNSDDAVTLMIRQWANGDSLAGDRLFARVYDELRVVAHRQRRRWRGDDTLNTTALVHELFLRMDRARAMTIHDRAHFYAVAARATRQILSNYARRTMTVKRGVGATVVELADVNVPPAINGDAPGVERLWALEVALQRLHRMHPRPCRVVECRYFGGLSIVDTALALDISEATVKRDWILAQAWLYRELRDHADT